ncbi:MAG: alpha/beta hydrolase [Candidatus Palauibacterales bacterium]|nr:alpha/beta hydrolase [Candidatus Palauibacterales bacterium]
MRRSLLVVTSVIAVLIVGAVVYGDLRSPERAPLDAAARAGAPGRFVALPHGITHYDLAGPDSGRVVVLVHGFSVPYYIWDSTTAGLTRAGYRVLRYDLYGRGLSDRPDVRYDGALYDDQLAALLDSLRITGPIDLAGVSFGGLVTAHFTTTHPGRVRTLTLIDPAAGRVELPWTLRAPVIGTWAWKTFHEPRLPEGQMTDFLHPENHPTWVDRYRPQMRYRGFGRALLSSMKAMGRTNHDSLYARVERAGTPVLLVWGRQDRTVPFRFSEDVRRDIPSAEFFPVDSAGHVSMIEQAAAVDARMTSFLEAHPGDAAEHARQLEHDVDE